MKRPLLITAVAVAAGAIAAAPAIAGLAGNPSFSQQIPVRVPSQAQLVQAAEQEPSRTPSSSAVPTRSMTPEPGDRQRTAHPEPGDDRGRGSSHAEPGDDRGRGSSHPEPGDDRGGRRQANGGRGSDDHGGSGRSGRDDDSSGPGRSGGDDHRRDGSGRDSSGRDGSGHSGGSGGSDDGGSGHSRGGPGSDG
jgi:hypothetical protein